MMSEWNVDQPRQTGMWPDNCECTCVVNNCVSKLFPLPHFSDMDFETRKKKKVYMLLWSS